MSDTPPPGTRHFHDSALPASQWKVTPEGIILWRMEGHARYGEWDAACCSLKSLERDPSIIETTQP